MPTMKSVQTAAPGTVEVVEIERPVPGPRDVLVRVRACGICSTDAAFVQMGGMPAGPEGHTAAIPLGYEPAGEIVEAGAEVVVNPQAARALTRGMVHPVRTVPGPRSAARVRPARIWARMRPRCRWESPGSALRRRRS